jgi:predicted acetyltransferase
LETLKKSNRSQVYKTLKDGLVLRQARPDEREKVLALEKDIFGHEGVIEVAYLLDTYPGFSLEDVLVVVNGEDKIVSSMCFLETYWHMGKTVIKFGQPEFVGTLPDYRGRGLIRAQIEATDRWMEEGGFAFGLIGGISYFYRLFGYEYALDFPRVGHLHRDEHKAVFTMPDNVVVRHSAESDAPELVRMWRELIGDRDVYMEYDEATWRWRALTRFHEESAHEDRVAVQDGKVIGAVTLMGKAPNILLEHFLGNELAAQALITDAFAISEVEMIRIGTDREGKIGQWIRQFNPRLQPPYAWFIKIMNVQRAFESLKGELERRVATSPFAGLTRDLEVGFYQSGILLKFENGAITEIKSIPGNQSPKLGIAPDVLPKVLFGYRDLDELQNMFPDLDYPYNDQDLMRTLFPRLKPMTRFVI